MSQPSQPGDNPKQGRRQNRRPRAHNNFQYSLAGPRVGPPRYDHHNTHYDEGYLESNPWIHRQQDDGPAFTLAGNFPRVVRWKGNGRSVKAKQKGESETAPQVPAAEELGSEVRDGTEGHDSVLEAGTSEEEDDLKQSQQIEQQGQPHVARSNSDQSGKLQQEQSDQTDQERNPLKPFNVWAAIRLRVQRPLGEWLGMTVFTFVGISTNLAVVTSSNRAGTMETQYWAWGLATMMGIYISGGNSGAFLNPALVIALSIFRGFPWRRVPEYIFAQVLGAFCGALLAFAIYRDSIMYLDGALVPDSTGVSMYIQPRAWTQLSTAFLCEVLGTAVLTCTIIALGDSHNSPPGAGMHAFIIGLVVAALNMAFAWPTRGCFNPARDLGPRLAALAVGYPLSSFSAWHSWWIWGGWLAPITGAMVGALAYDVCIFKGGESPVNYSVSRWRHKRLRGKRNFFKKLCRSRKHVAIERKLESGDVTAQEDMC